MFSVLLFDIFPYVLMHFCMFSYVFCMFSQCIFICFPSFFHMFSYVLFLTHFHMFSYIFCHLSLYCLCIFIWFEIWRMYRALVRIILVVSWCVALCACIGHWPFVNSSCALGVHHSMGYLF